MIEQGFGKYLAQIVKDLEGHGELITVYSVAAAIHTDMKKEIARIKSELNESKETLDKASNIALKIAMEYNNQNDKLEKCKETLEFYCNEDNYFYPMSDKTSLTTIDFDEGVRARKTLKELEAK